MKFYFITDSRYCDREEFLKRVEGAIKGGASIVQIREKDITTREYINFATKVHEVTKKYGVPLIIDDRIDVMLASGAEGVHLGAEDMTVKDARRILGSEKIIGATAKTVPWAKECEEMGADYLGVGTIYPTKTKVKTTSTSIETLKEIIKEVKIPVYAIGGLTKDNLSPLKGLDIAGICAVSAVMARSDSEVAAREICEEMKKL